MLRVGLRRDRHLDVVLAVLYDESEGAFAVAGGVVAARDGGREEKGGEGPTCGAARLRVRRTSYQIRKQITLFLTDFRPGPHNRYADPAPDGACPLTPHDISHVPQARNHAVLPAGAHRWHPEYRPQSPAPDAGLTFPHRRDWRLYCGRSHRLQRRPPFAGDGRIFGAAVCAVASLCGHNG